MLFCHQCLSPISGGRKKPSPNSPLIRTIGHPLPSHTFLDKIGKKAASSLLSFLWRSIETSLFRCCYRIGTVQDSAAEFTQQFFLEVEKCAHAMFVI